MANNSQMKVSIIVDLMGNLTSKARQYTSAITQMSARSKASLASMRSSVASTSAAIDQAGNRTLMGATAAGYAFNQTFLNTARQAERYKLQMKALFGDNGADKAMQWAKQNAKDTVLGLDDVISAMGRLKSYGADPFQLLPTLEDEAARNGWTPEAFGSVVDAIGKMFADGKITDEYNDVLTGNQLSLIPRLSAATGKTQAELVQMMSKGQLKLGALRLAFKQMAIESKGASQQAMSGINGMLSNASDNWEDFQRRVMDAGVTDELKSQLKPLLSMYEKGADSGLLDKKAKETGQIIIKVIQEATAAGRGLYSVMSQVASVLDKGAQAMGGWENAAKVVAAIYVSNKALRMGGAAVGVGRGAYNIGRGAYTVGRGGWNLLRGKKGKGTPGAPGATGDAAGLLTGITDVQQVYVTNWPVGIGSDINTGSGRKGRKGRGKGKINPASRATDALDSMPGKGSAARAALRTGGKFAGKAIPVAGAVLSIAELATSDNATEAGEAIGGAAGAVIGGALGSVVPVVGTAIGSIVGSYLGSWLGGMAGGWMDEKPAAAAPQEKQGAELKVKVELDDSLKMRSMQAASYGGMGLYTGGMPLY